MSKVYKHYLERSPIIQGYIRQLSNVLPYGETWYEGLTDKQIIGIRHDNIGKIVAYAIQCDEYEVRKRAGL